LLHDPVHRELLERGEMGGHGVESAADADAAAGLPLSRVVAHRLSEAELGELGRAKVVDHPADRVERGAELALEIRELGAKRLPDLRRDALGAALEVFDLEDR